MRGRNTKGSSMKTYAMEEIGLFRSPEQIERAFYGSESLEVRAGIVHALTTCGYGEIVPYEWWFSFIFQVCRETILEIARLDSLNDSHPYPPDRTPHEEFMARVGQKNEWSIKAQRLESITRSCVTWLLSCNCNSNDYDEEVCERLLLFFGREDVAPHLDITREPQRKTLVKFLEFYRDVVLGRNEKVLPFEWFNLAFRTLQLSLVDDLTEGLVVRMAQRYLNAVWKGGTGAKAKQPTLSVFLSGRHHPLKAPTREIAEMLARLHCRQGKFDRVIP